MGDIEFHSVTPIFNVENVPRSIDYYVNVLGFSLVLEWGDPVEFAGVKRGNVEIFLSQEAQGEKGSWISVFISDVDSLFKEYKRKKAIIKQEPTDFAWGVREMNIQDPDGHRIRFTMHIETSTDNEDIVE